MMQKIQSDKTMGLTPAELELEILKPSSYSLRCASLYCHSQPIRHAFENNIKLG